MAKKNVDVDFQLRRARDMFVQKWGQMSSSWGISRTTAEIHGLLYLSDEPLCTDQIMDRLQISRGNASMTLRGLVDWGLIRKEHRRGDRKEYFVSETDAWQLFEIIARQRKRREIEPVIDAIKDSREMLGEAAIGKSGARQSAVASTRERLDQMQEFLESIDALFDKFLAEGPTGLRRVLKWLLKTI
jgi:DNA-binding transcriptional regulator GbsR (MarR family)